jgi:hypothetical protein
VGDAGTYVGRLQRRVFWSESHVAHDGARMTTLDMHMSLARWPTDTMHVSGAWIKRRMSSYRRTPVLQKPCSLGFESGFPPITLGENVKICLMVVRSSKHPHLYIMERISIICYKNGKRAPRQERSVRG